MANAEVCRRRGWGPDTIVQVEDDFGAARFVITAVGQSLVLGKQVSSREWGFSWSASSGREDVIGVSLESAAKVDAYMETANA